MGKEKYRIISIEASNIIEANEANGEEVGVSFDTRNKKEYYKKFNNVLDFSLDSAKLKERYEKKLRKKFAFYDDRAVAYTDAVVNVNFDYKYSDHDKKEISTQQMRKMLYERGFVLNGNRYVRYKRSAGSSRQGKCLFIRQELIADMEKWGECGLDKNMGDIASWEAYKALSLSSIKDTIDIPINGILFVEDYSDEFEEEVVAVRQEGEKVFSSVGKETIVNNIWDGESLLDESIFNDKFPDKHMVLLRNKFFKSCAFKTKIQKWFKDNDITTIKQLTDVGGVTLAKDISEIVMITTPSSLKYLKFSPDKLGKKVISADKLSKKAISAWAKHVDNTFGAVKFDKRTRFFNGRIVRTSYQFLNTIGINEEEAGYIIEDSVQLLTDMRDDPAIMRHYFSELANREKDETHPEDDQEELLELAGDATEEPEEEIEDGISGRAGLLFPLIDYNKDFRKTTIYYAFRDAVTQEIKKDLKKGHLLVDGTYATLFGNGPELLMHAIGKFNREDRVLGPGEIRCTGFRDDMELVCARSPHITMGNLYLVKNKTKNDMWQYFELGKNIVCVNAIGENIQQRLNGCDYDSDTMLITSNTTLIEVAKKYYDFFKVPVCRIKEGDKDNKELYEADALASNNKIGEIVNLSQRLNSILWHKLNTHGKVDEILNIYYDICILAVLSGIEIDKAKRNYTVSCASVISKIRKKYEEVLKPKPAFFYEIDKEKANKTHAKLEDEDYKECKTPMDFIYTKIKESTDYRRGKGKKKELVLLENLFKEKLRPENNDYKIKDAVLKMLEEYKKQVAFLRGQMKSKDSEEAEVIREEIAFLKQEKEREVVAKIRNLNVFRLVLSSLEKKKEVDWIFYSILLCHNDYFKQLIKEGNGRLEAVYEDPTGTITLCGYNYSKS